MDGSRYARNGTVLVAEHQAVAGMWLEDVLTDAGYVVDGPHPTCEAALAVLRRGRPDYAVVSVELRQGPCFTLACALRQADVPFMLLSGAPRVVPSFRDVPVIERPCRDEELLASLACALQAQRIHRERVPVCRRASLLAGPGILAVDQCPPACGA